MLRRTLQKFLCCSFIRNQNTFSSLQDLNLNKNCRIILLIFFFAFTKFSDLFLLPRITNLEYFGRNFQSEITIISLTILAFLLSFYFDPRKKTQQIRRVFTILGSLLLAIYAAFNNINCIEEAILLKTQEFWSFSLMNILAGIYLTIFSDLLIAQYSLKLLVPGSYYFSILFVYWRLNDEMKFWALLKSISALFFTFIILLLQQKTRFRLFTKTREMENQIQFYKEILNNLNSSIAVIDHEKLDILFSNREFSSLLENYHQDKNKLFGSFIDLKKRVVSKIPSSLADQEYLLNLNNKSPKNTFLTPFYGCNQEQSVTVASRSVRSSFPSAKLKDSTNSIEFKTFTNLLEGFQNSIMPEDAQIYDGKLYDTRIRAKSSNYSIQICPLQDPKKILLIFTNTNHYYQAAALEQNNHYKDSLLSSISHELRTPLNGTLSCLQAALNDKRVPIVVKETLIDPALRSGKLLLHTINDILDYSLVQSQELSLLIERKSIIDTLTNAFKLCEKATVTKGIDYILNLESDIPVEFTTDHERLAQVVLNLLTNALKFTFKGSITLKATWIEDSIIEISVKDTGIGMSQVEVDALLEEFLNPLQSPSRRKKSQGVGLGLKICNHLISYLGPNDSGLEIKVGDQGSEFSFRVENKISEACQTSDSSFSSGEVDADEKEELRIKRDEPKFQFSLYELCNNQNGKSPKEEKNSEGEIETLREDDKKFNKFTESYVSCFRIESPFFPPAAKSRKRTQLGLPISSFNEGEPNHPKDILVVDDDPINILGMRLLLSKLKLSIDVAYNGQQAVEKVQNKFKLANSTATSRYKLIFMDCQMPIMDGYEASRILTGLMKSAEIPETAIIGCTAFTAKNKLDECIASGMSGVITKPVVIDKLKNIIKKYMK